MLRLTPLLALSLAGCATASTAPSPSPASSSRGIASPPVLPWEGEALKRFDWATLSPSAPTDRSDQFLTIAVPEAPETWDPHKAYSDTAKLVARSLFEGLVTRHPATCQPLPAIAQWWDVSPGRTVYTFHLRQDARWSDGTKITAADVRWSLERARSDDVDGPARDLLASIATVAGLREGVLQITLAEPDPRFIHALADPVAAVVHRASIETRGKAAFDREHIVGSGAFVRGAALEPRSRKVGGRVLLTRNPNHWAGARSALRAAMLVWPKDSEPLPLRWYESGSVDWVPWLYLDGQGAERYPPDAYTDAGATVSYLIVNCRRRGHVLVDPRARRALSLALPRLRAAAASPHAHRPAGRLIPPAVPGYPSLKPARSDPAEGRRLWGLACAGRATTAVSLVYPDLESRHAAAWEIARAWRRDLGVTVTLNAVPVREYQARLETGEFDVAALWWKPRVPHPLGCLERWSARTANLAGLDGTFVEPALTDAGRLAPPENLARCGEIERWLLHEVAAAIPFARSPLYGVINPRVRGLTPNVMNEHRLRYLRVERE